GGSAGEVHVDLVRKRAGAAGLPSDLDVVRLPGGAGAGEEEPGVEGPERRVVTRAGAAPVRVGRGKAGVVVVGRPRSGVEVRGAVIQGERAAAGEPVVEVGVDATGRAVRAGRAELDRPRQCVLRRAVERG